MKAFSIGKPVLKQLSGRRAGVDGLLLSGTMGGLIMLVAQINPDILSRGEVDARTKKQRAFFFIPSLSFLFGIPLLSNIRLRRQNKGELSFYNAFLNAYIVGGIGNLFDLLVLDYLLLLIWKPGFIKSLASEADPIYYSYSFHFKAFLRGMIITLVPSLVAASLGEEKDAKLVRVVLTRYFRCHFKRPGFEYSLICFQCTVNTRAGKLLYETRY